MLCACAAARRRPERGTFMRISFRPLAALACRHSYFEDGVARALTMAPTAECRRLMRRHRCLLRGARGGGAIHAGLDEAGLHVAGLDAGTPLAFALTCDDPYFPSYTAADWAPGSVAYYSNLGAAATGAQVLAGERVALKTRAFSHSFPAPRRGAELAVLRARDGATVWAGPAPAGEFDALALDLRALGEGHYELRIDGAAALAFYLADAAAPAPWGVVELFGLAGLAAGGAAPAAPPLYVVALEARATIWRYVFLGAAGATLAVTGRVAPAQPVAFSGPAPMPLGPLAGAAFDSQTPIALRERPNGRYAMSLSIRRDAASAETTLALPCAGRDTPIVGGAAAAVSQIVMTL